MFYQAIGNSIQANKDKIEKLEKQNARLKKQKKDLQQENQQLKEVIEEVKTEISSLMSKYFYEKDFCIEDIHLDKLLQILDKAKGE